MEFKALVVVFFGLLSVAASAPDQDWRDPALPYRRPVPLSAIPGGALRDSLLKYNLKISRDGEQYDEKIEVDTEKKTATIHVPQTSSADAADVIYDLRKKQRMIRVPSTKSCFLYNSLGNIPAKSEELVRLLNNNKGNNGAVLKATPLEGTLDVMDSVDDRSDLSDEMKDLCAKMPIYRVIQKARDKRPANRKKRFLGAVAKVAAKVLCHYVCREKVCTRVCDSNDCETICKNVGCTRVC